MPNFGIKEFSLPWKGRVASGSTAGNGTRPVRRVWVGNPIDPLVTPTGGAQSPYTELSDALAWVATQPPGQFEIICSPQDYADATVPPGYSLVISAGVTAPGTAHIGTLTMTGTAGGGFPCIMRGFAIDNIATASDGGVDPQAVLVVLESGLIGPISNGAGIGLSVIGAGVFESANLIISAVFTGVVSVGPGGFCVFTRADIQQPITADLMTFTDCRIPSALTTYGSGQISLRECKDGAFPAATTVTFGAPGALLLDTISAGTFIEAGCSIVNGSVTIDDVGAYTGCIAGEALTPGAPVFPLGGQVILVDGSADAMRRFLGFAQLTSLGIGDAQIVASPGISPHGLGVLNPDRAYYVSGAVVGMSPMYFFSEDDLPAFLAGAPAGSWYRQVGVSIDASTFIHAWGDPIEVGSSPLSVTRPLRQLWVGDPLIPVMTPDGSEQAPYAELADAIAWIFTQPAGLFQISASPQAYAACTWPAGYGGAIDCSAGGAAVSDLTLDPFSGPAQRLTFRGFDVGDVDTSAAGAPTDTVLLRIERQGTIGTLSNTGGADVYLELVGAEEPTAVPASVSALGPLDKGAGTLTIQADSADIQQAVDCTSYTSTDCRNPENITAADITVTEAEDDQGVRSGSVWTATSCRIDQITAQRFATAGGSLIGGTFTIIDDGPWIASQGKTALVPGTPVYMVDDGGTLKVRAVDGTFAALRQDFVGFTGLTTAADGDAQLVVGNGGRAISIPGAITGGVYGALVPGKAYYVSGAVGVSTTVWLIFSEDDFSGIGGFNADAPAGSGYRLVGIADTTTTIMQAWEDAATT